MLKFEIQGNGWDLSMMRISFSLMIRTIPIKRYKIILCKLTNSGNIIDLYLNYKLMRPVIILRLPKE